MAPKLRIQAHVFYYAGLLAVTTAGALGISKMFSQSEEEKIKNLMEKYPEIYEKNKSQREGMQRIFDKMKNADVDDSRFNDILKGGRGDIKRTQIISNSVLPDTSSSNESNSKS